MRRAWVVILATVAGLVGVLTFHTAPATLSAGAPLAGTAPARTTTTAPAVTGPPAPTTGSSSTAASPAASPATTSPNTATRTATGAAVNYFYGDLSVSATVSGAKLTHVGIASINDGGNFRSQSIDQASIPVLEQEALAAQSANIQGVSGASYTSAGFAQSLQSALSKLNFR